MKIKKLIFFSLLLFFINSSIVSANSSVIATLNKCVDGDTAWFNIENEVIKARFLAIDTPESTNKIEEYGKEASNFTCNKLSSAKKIILEYDDNSNKLDKYSRHLVWVFVDDELLQEELLKEGLAEIKYLYGDYKYTNHLQEIENIAKSNKINIWNDNYTNDINYLYIIIGILILLAYMFTKRGRRKVIKRIINKIKKA